MSPAVARLGLSASRFGGTREGRGPSEAEVFALLALAADAGVSLIDASPAYGDAEALLGRVLPRRTSLRLTTRTDAMAKGVDAVERAARASLERLGRTQAHTLLVANARALEGADGAALWTRLRALQAEGLFERIGVVACVCDDPLALSRRLRLDVIQVPASLVDQRLILDGTVEAVAALGVEVRLRTTLLQGPPFGSDQPLPADFAKLAPGVARVHAMLREADVDPVQASLAFALAQPAVSGVVLNAASVAELRTLLVAAAAPPPKLDWNAFALQAPCLFREHCAA